MLKIEACRKRQQRLLKVMHQRQLDAAVMGWYGHVYYFSGVRPHWMEQGAFVLRSDGRSCLIANRGLTVETAADELIEFDAALDYTYRPDQPVVVADLAMDWLKKSSSRRIGMDCSEVSSAVALRCDPKPEDVQGDLWQLRRCKDADELALMGVAIRCAEAMYARGRQIIEPGVAELTVFNQLHEAAVAAAGEPMSAQLGNDFTSGGGGGMPRRGRLAQAGEIFILDLGPSYRGYFSDTCRSIAVDGRVTDVQYKVWEGVMGALKLFESMAKPGVRCRGIAQAVQEHYRRVFGTRLIHHTGHGVGLWPHEFPHVDEIWDDVLLEGETVSIEPGKYGPELGGGMRIENTYLITADGPRNLVNSPMELA
jgi:Xaa-Pro aminopeptidase